MKKYLVNKLVEANLVKIISETKIQKTYHSVQKITPEEEKLYEDIIHDLKCDDFLEKFPTLEHFIVSYNLGLEATPKCVCGKPCKISYGKYSYRATCGDRKCIKISTDKACREKYGDNYEIRNEKTRKTNREKYGVDCYTQTAEFLEKAKQTNLEKYGTEWGTQSSVVKEKIEKTQKEKYGGKWASQTKEFREKVNNTFIENHNGMTPSEYFSSEEVQERTKKTSMERYGYDNPGKAPQFIEKGKQTQFERYGNYFAATEEGQAKIREGNQRKYGVDNVMHLPEYVALTNAKYYYDNNCFDSKPELAFYVYHKEFLNENIERCPLIIPYINYFNDKEHKYLPDFRIGDKLIEIKGTDLIDKETGHWIPYERDLKECQTEEEKQALLCQYHSKQLCAEANNVIVFTNKDKEVLEAITWVRSNKGKNFLNKCRRK